MMRGVTIIRQYISKSVSYCNGVLRWVVHRGSGNMGIPHQKSIVSTATTAVTLSNKTRNLAIENRFHDP